MSEELIVAELARVRGAIRGLMVSQLGVLAALLGVMLAVWGK